MSDFKALWDKALPFEPFVASCKAEHCGLWRGIYGLARIPDWALAAVPPGASRKLLAPRPGGGLCGAETRRCGSSKS